MGIRVPVGILGMVVVCSNLLAQAGPSDKPEGELARVIQGFLSQDFTGDWVGVEELPLIRWAALPAGELKNCLPDGSCYARQGAARVAGRNMAAIAAGARTFPVNLYLRNGSAPFGEAAVLAALRDASFTVDLARCPVPGQSGGTNWYRLRSPKTTPGVLSVQTSCNGTKCEGFVVSQGDSLPALQANQVRLYSEQCGSGADRKPVSTMLPHEVLAQTLASLIPPASAAGLYDWKALTTMNTQIQWTTPSARKSDLSFLGDPNPFSLSGSVTFAGRQFSSMASGAENQVKVVYFDESRLHAPGEDLIGALRSQGFAVQIARCGPVYTESTNNWYRVSHPKTKTVMLRQSIRRDGNQVQDSYALRLDSTLPARDPRDRDPGVAGCR